MKRYFLVDTENVHMKGLKGLEALTEDDTVIVFLTNECYTDATKISKIERYHKCTIKQQWVKNGRKNALDFQLTSYLGILFHEHKDEKVEYYIISEDKGYLSSIEFLQQNYSCHIELHPDMNLLDRLKEKYRNVKGLQMPNDYYTYEELRKHFKKSKTCSKILNIMKVTDNKNLALEMIENVFVKSHQYGKHIDWRDKVSHALKIYYN